MKQRTRVDEAVEGIIEGIEQDFPPLWGRDAHSFRLALNEARALAWSSEVPHLVLPVLAQEKLESVVARQAIQERIREASARILTMVA